MFGLGLKITEEQLEEMNKRIEGISYKNEEATTYLLEKEAKNSLTESPIVHYELWNLEGRSLDLLSYGYPN